jgi:phosphate transport system permease protein
MALSTPSSSADRAAATVRSGLTARQADPLGRAFQGALWVAVLATIAILGVLIYDVVTHGWGVLAGETGDFLTGRLGSQPENSGLGQAIRGTFYIGVFVVALTFPLGISAAIYLEEYARHGRLNTLISVAIRNLAGVPSVVYGILGLTIFVKALGGLTGPDANGRTVVSAGLTLSILVLPIVIITAAEALRAVPNGIREGGFGVGATRWEVVRSHVLPYAAPGILTGTVIALARALGEAAPLILVGATTGFLSGGDSYLPDSLRERFTALPIVISTWSGRPGDDWAASTSAAIVVLLVIVFAANFAAILLRNRFERRRR